MLIAVRLEEAGDLQAIRRVNELAFGREKEAGIVDALRLLGPDILSLVALKAGAVVGHILFSPVIIAGDGAGVGGKALGPLAVLPKFQRQGVGSALVRSGLDILREHACPFVVVLGHPEYYPRFGFKPASRQGIRSQWEGLADEVFMVLILDESRMMNVQGVAHYNSVFDEA